MWKMSVLLGVAAPRRQARHRRRPESQCRLITKTWLGSSRNCRIATAPTRWRVFSLLTYEQARKRASDLAHVTGERIMPPWPASSSFGGPFRDARVLTGDEIATLQSWVESNCPEGDPKDALATDVFFGLGARRSPTSSSRCERTGSDDFRVFVLKTNFPRIAGFGPSVRSGRSIVHHIIAGVDPSNRGKLGKADPGLRIVQPRWIRRWSAHLFLPCRSGRPAARPGVLRRHRIHAAQGADVFDSGHYHKSVNPRPTRPAWAFIYPKSRCREVHTDFVFPTSR